MITGWSQSAPAFLASFLSSAVEFVEALTIVLAVGVTRGWRAAWLGVSSAAAALAALVLVFGATLQRVPLHWLQLVVGILLLLFGTRWLRKAILRFAGVIELHDETAAFVQETEALSKVQLASGAVDLVGFAASFKAVMLEGLEVVFIVIAVGTAGKSLPAACLGAGAAGIIVILLGVLLHRPLTRVPENSLKFAVGILLSAFGTFWTGEGLHLHWPGEDWAILGLIAAYLAIAWLAIRLARQDCRLERQVPQN